MHKRWQVDCSGFTAKQSPQPFLVLPALNRNAANCLTCKSHDMGKGCNEIQLRV